MVIKAEQLQGSKTTYACASTGTSLAALLPWTSGSTRKKRSTTNVLVGG